MSMRASSRCLSYVWIFALLVSLQGCATHQAAQSEASEGLAKVSVGSLPASGWKVMHLPGKRKTSFTSVWHDGRHAVQAVASSSVSMYRQILRLNPDALGMLRFSWQSPQLIPSADMAERETEDSVVRVVLSFEGDRSKFSAKNKMLSELSLALTGEELPYATLMYVWCNTRPVGDVIVNPRTERIRKIVVESGAANLSKWLDYERDIRADFIQAFGEEPGALTGIALMTDTDNTQTQATAWYGPVILKPRVAVTP
jgi:Protein of unknown function (DUF3047)